MGDETIQFANRFTRAMSDLALLGSDETLAELRREHGPDLAPRVQGALDAIEAVYETGTEAVRNWPEKRQRVLAQVAATRAALRAGVTPEVRRLAGELVRLVEPAAKPAKPRRA